MHYKFPSIAALFWFVVSSSSSAPPAQSTGWPLAHVRASRLANAHNANTRAPATIFFAQLEPFVPASALTACAPQCLGPIICLFSLANQPQTQSLRIPEGACSSNEQPKHALVTLANVTSLSRSLLARPARSPIADRLAAMGSANNCGPSPNEPELDDQHSLGTLPRAPRNRPFSSPFLI